MKFREKTDAELMAMARSLVTELDLVTQELALRQLQPGDDQELLDSGNRFRRKPVRFRCYTTVEAARMLGVSEAKVKRWINACELKASNVAEHKIDNPRWRILEDDLLAFMEGRQPAPRVPQRRYRSCPYPGGPIDPELGEKLAKKGQATKSGKHWYRVWNGMTLYF
jgi:hypothetical protein